MRARPDGIPRSVPAGPGEGAEPTTAEKLRRLPWSIAANALNAIYSQLTFFGSVFVLFLSQLGLAKTTIGGLLSLIPFFGLVALAVAPAVARTGYKRVYVTCFTIRKFITLALLATPWVLAVFGPKAVLWVVLAVIGAFSLFRALAITASHPWEQEYIPDSVRGRYAAANQIATGLAGFAAVGAASAFLGADPGLGDFGALFAVGTAFGLVSMVAWTRVPGGAPASRSQVESASPRSMALATRDPNLARFLAGLGLVTLASAGLGSFVTLFMREAAGLNAAQVVQLQAASLVGGLLTSFFWGWAADRYGSRPVTLLGLYLKAFLPVLWLAMPRESGWTLPVAMGGAVWQGVANMGWTVGATRLLFSDVVPPAKRAGYMAVHYAFLSVVEGLSQVLSGRLLDLTAGLEGRWLGLVLDRYSILFAVGIVLPLAGSLPLRRIRTAGSVSARRLAGMLLRGRPLLALGSLVRYRLARSEPDAVAVTERLGQARSPLTVEELLESLSDPRFNVRYEAVVAMAHHGAEARLTGALSETLMGRDPALSAAAAWALGRSGDRSAIPALRGGLDSRYRSVQAHSARSLAALGDADSAPLLLERLLAEHDAGLRDAYAAALGRLRYRPAATALLERLRVEADRQSRSELALALARLAGEERLFVQLVRQRSEVGTALSQAVAGLEKRLQRRWPEGRVAERLGRCAEALARDELELGVALLADLLRELPRESLGEPAAEVVGACAASLASTGALRFEYLALALSTLSALPEGE